MCNAISCNVMQFNIMSFNSDSDSDSNSNPNSDSISIYFDLERRSKKGNGSTTHTREEGRNTTQGTRESSTHQLHYLNLFQVIAQNPRWGITGGFCLWAAQVNPSEVGVHFSTFLSASNLVVIDTVMQVVNVDIDFHLTSYYASLYVSSGEPTLAADVCQSTSRMRRHIHCPVCLGLEVVMIFYASTRNGHSHVRCTLR